MTTPHQTFPAWGKTTGWLPPSHSGLTVWEPGRTQPNGPIVLSLSVMHLVGPRIKCKGGRGLRRYYESNHVRSLLSPGPRDLHPGLWGMPPSLPLWHHG